MQRFIFVICLFIIGCSPYHYDLAEGDLVFQLSPNSAFTKAIKDATQNCDSISFTHVGIICRDNGEWKVLEATSENGVVLTCWNKFLERSAKESGNPKVVVKHLKGKYPIADIILRARQYLGQKYDWEFLPENGKCYCSELVYQSYIDNNGGHIFTAKPMQFRDSNGNMPTFWIEKFREIAKPIPEGVVGTNPNDMYKEIVDRDL